MTAASVAVSCAFDERTTSPLPCGRGRSTSSVSCSPPSPRSSRCPADSARISAACAIGGHLAAAAALWSHGDRVARHRRRAAAATLSRVPAPASPAGRGCRRSAPPPPAMIGTRPVILAGRLPRRVHVRLRQRPRAAAAFHQRAAEPAGPMGRRLVSADRHRRLPLRAGDPTIQQNIVFFPAYPMLMRVDRPAARRRHDRLRRRRACSSRSRRFSARWSTSTRSRAIATATMCASGAIWLLAAYPFAIFFGAIYTESLFLLGTVGAFYHFSRQQFGRAALLGTAGRPDAAQRIAAGAAARPARALHVDGRGRK